MKLISLMVLLSTISLESSIILSMGVLFLSLLSLQGIMLEVNTISLSMSWFMVLLSAWLTMLMISANYKPQNYKVFLILMSLSLFVLSFCFTAGSMLSFYFFFESILIPIFLVVMGWGYQPERLTAALYMFFYTLLASLPLLIGLLLIISDMSSGVLILMKMANYSMNSIFLLVMSSAFLVKFPIYFFHLWLPKAHVEAPVSGSMLLAGVLLKLGGYGLFLMMAFFPPNLMFNSGVTSLSLVGSGLLGLMILRMTDMKVAIAYSSVVHMSMVIVVLMSVSSMGVVGGLWMMIAHGVTSSGMFGGANMMYERSHTRSLVSNKGLLSLMPFFTMMWFLLIVMNFAGPFTINLFSEIIMISALMSLSWWASIPIAMLCFFSAAYNLNLYASSQQGSASKSFYGVVNLNSRESMVLFSHVWPALLLLGGLLTLNSNMKSMKIL